MDFRLRGKDEKINPKKIRYIDTLVTTPDFGDVFDEQYHKTMGFKNEKYLYEITMI